MLTDIEQAKAKHYLDDAIESLGQMLNVVESGFNKEDWDLCRKLGLELQGCKDILTV
jgi:hypothetical protein